MVAEAANETVLSVQDLSYSYALKSAGKGKNKSDKNSSDRAGEARSSETDSSVDVSYWTIHKLNLQVQQGEIVCILGASGCGKSTLLNLIAGLLQPDSGQIDVRGDKALAGQMDTRITSAGSGRIGYIFQQDALLPWRTVQDNMLIATALNPAMSKEQAKGLVKQYLRTFSLSELVLNKYPSELSGGMRQRVSIIQSLMFDPELLLLDEPFSALDFFTKLKLECEFYQLIKEKNKAAVMVTHDIEESIAMADRVLLMDKTGCISKEFAIDLEQTKRSPETARGTAKFAEYYRLIWSDLKAVIEP